MDNLDPRLLWYAAGFVGTLSVIGFTYLHFKAGKLFEEKTNGSNGDGKKESVLEKPVLDGDAPILSYE
jgi:hypothetical protein